jgi:hypothetical protein
MAYRTIQIKPSTNILGVSYDEETMDLRVQFLRDGRAYTYSGVDARTAEGFSRAESAGQYLNAFIKNQYPFVEGG